MVEFDDREDGIVKLVDLILVHYPQEQKEALQEEYRIPASLRIWQNKLRVLESLHNDITLALIAAYSSLETTRKKIKLYENQAKFYTDQAVAQQTHLQKLEAQICEAKRRLKEEKRYL